MYNANNRDNVITDQFHFYRKSDNELLDVIKADFNQFGQIYRIYVNTNGETVVLDSTEFVYTNTLLNVPGLGVASCGDTVVLSQYRKKPKMYKLGFGWHINSSNQNIYSWYLFDPTEDPFRAKVKTLYFDDIPNILGIQNNVPGMLPDDIITNY